MTKDEHLPEYASLDSAEIFEIIKREKTLEKCYIAIINKIWQEEVCFTEQTKPKVSKALASLKKELEKLNVKFWIDWGTFLGAYRSSSIIPWDKDIDIAILSRDKSKFLQAISSLPITIKENRAHYLSLKIDEIIGRVSPEIDVNIWDKLENEEGLFITDPPRNNHKRSFKHFENLDSIALNDLDLSLPCPNLNLAEELLSGMYGEGFMSPPANPFLDKEGKPWMERPLGENKKLDQPLKTH